MDILFTEDGQTDDPEAYLIPRRAAELDLGDAVREELILAVPEYVLCREDCRGMCPRCGVDLNAGPCDCTPVPGPGGSVFEVLRRLGPEDTR